MFSRYINVFKIMFYYYCWELLLIFMIYVGFNRWGDNIKSKIWKYFLLKILCLRVGFFIFDLGERSEIVCFCVLKYVLKCVILCLKINESLKIYCRKSKGIF